MVERRNGTAPDQRQLKALLSSPILPWLAALAAVVLTLPSLSAGWILDDYLQRVRFIQDSRFREMVGSELDLFCFVDGDETRTHQLMDAGIYPWWTCPQLLFRFWRPITSLTHWIDYRVWPGWPSFMHLQSIFWYGMLTAAVGLLYRRIGGSSVAAGVAALLYAVDDAHATPVGFLANRNALIAAFFGVVSIYSHDRWRREGAASSLVAAILALGISLLAGEAGIGTVAYLLSYAITKDQGSPVRRLMTLMPYGVLVVGWRLAWQYVGAGAFGAGIYHDPLGDPVGFVRRVLERAPILLLGQLATPPSEIDGALPRTGHFVLVVVAWIAIAALGWGLWRVLRADRTARFWALGMLLAILPCCTAFPGDRLLLFVGIGAMALLAPYLIEVRGWFSAGGPPVTTSAALRAITMFLAFLHVIAAPLALPVRSAYPILVPGLSSHAEMHVALHTAETPHSVVFVNPPIPGAAGLFPLLREARGEPVPAYTRVLSSGMYPLEVTRLDERSVLLRPHRGFMPARFDRLFRGPDCPMAAGDRVELSGVAIEVRAVASDGAPSEAVFRFDVPLEDPSLLWLQWGEGEFTTFALPAVGESVTLSTTLRSLISNR